MEVTRAMLDKAVMQAVREGLIPKRDVIDNVAKNTDKIKKILDAALNPTTYKDERCEERH